MARWARPYILNEAPFGTRYLAAPGGISTGFPSSLRDHGTPTVYETNSPSIARQTMGHGLLIGCIMVWTVLTASGPFGATAQSNYIAKYRQVMVTEWSLKVLLECSTTIYYYCGELVESLQEGESIFNYILNTPPRPNQSAT
jgi:hypothetical protein